MNDSRRNTPFSSVAAFKDTRQPSQSAASCGYALWAAKKAYAASISPFLFPRCCDDKKCHSNSASATLNKWLKRVAGKDFVIHSFRHSMRDRLRAVNCPSDMIDQIGGWSSGKIGEGHGEGYLITTKEDAILGIVASG